MKKLKSNFALLKFFTLEYMLFIILFILLRFFFLYKTYNPVFETSPFLIFKGFLYGWIFDTAIISYSLILITAVFIITKIFYPFFGNKKIIINSVIKNIIFLILILFSTFLFAFYVADSEYYQTFNSHITAKDTDYFSSFELVKTVWQTYPVVTDILLIILFVGIFSFFTRKNLNSLFKGEDENKRIKFQLFELFYSLIILGLFVIGARGGVNTSTLNWGRAVFSENYYTTQFTINPIFLFGKSLDLERKSNKSGANKITKHTKKEIQNFATSFIDSTDIKIKSSNQLLRITDTKIPENKYNIVLVLMESWMANNIGILENNPGVTPNFDRIAKDGILFSKFFSSGIRSNRGIVSVLCSFPSPIGKSIMKKPAGQKPFLSLPKTLKERGYTTSFIYGGDINFDNMRGFMMTNGIDNFIGKRDFPNHNIVWGVSDDIMFDRTIKYIKDIKKPHFTMLFTLSNHEPFDIPQEFQKYTEKDYPNNKYLNAYYYSDYCLGQFYDNLKKEGLNKNTILIFVADHGVRINSKIPLASKRFHIPLLIVPPKDAKIEPQIISKISSQVDIFPTIMHILGGKYTNAAWGVDLFKENKINQAFITKGGWFGTITEIYSYVGHTGFKGELYSNNFETITQDSTNNKQPKPFSQNKLDEKKEEYSDVFKNLKKTTEIFMQLTLEQIQNRTFGEK